MLRENSGRQQPDIRIAVATLDGGGNERDCVRLANRWASEGKKVEVLLVKKQGAYLASLDSRVEVFASGKSRTFKSIPAIVRQLMLWPKVPVLIFGFDLGVGLGVFKMLGLLRAPLIYREGSLPRQNVPRSRLWAYRLFVARADGIVAQTKYALNELEELGVKSTKRRVIWNPSEIVNEKAYRMAPHDPTAAAPLRLLAVGRLSREKGLLRLIEGFAGYLRLHPKAVLTIAGQGPQRAELESAVERLRISDNVRFLGFVADVGQLYRDCEMLVLPSFFEGLPNVLLEALQHGCAVMAAGGEGVGEVLVELDLAECWWNGADFVQDFPAAVTRAWVLPESRWSLVRGKLRADTNVAAVAEAYLEFCQLVSAQCPE